MHCILCVGHVVTAVYVLLWSFSQNSNCPYSLLLLSASLFCSPLTLKITRHPQIPPCNDCECFCLLLPQCIKWEVNPPACLQQDFTITKQQTEVLIVLCVESKPPTVWLAPHLFRLMEGGGPLGEGSHADAPSEWQARYIVRDFPLALTLLYSRRLLKQGGIKKNGKKQPLSRAELLYMRCHVALLLYSVLSSLKVGQRVG